MCYLFHMWQYNILQPLNPKSPYDFAVERDGIFKKIQVKTTAVNSQKVALKRGTYSRYNTKFNYEQGDFDYLCWCNFPTVHIIPYDKLKSKHFVTFGHYPEYRYDLNDKETYNIRPI